MFLNIISFNKSSSFAKSLLFPWDWMPKVQFCHNVYFLPFHCGLVLRCTHTHRKTNKESGMWKWEQSHANMAYTYCLSPGFVPSVAWWSKWRHASHLYPECVDGRKNKNTSKVVETTCVTSGVINHLCAPPIIWWTFSLPNLVKPCKLSWLDGVLTKSSWLCKTCGRTQPGTSASLVLPIRMDIDMISIMISMYGMNGHLMSSDILKLECYNA